jgi:hypothetical protein
MRKGYYDYPLQKGFKVIVLVVCHVGTNNMKVQQRKRRRRKISNLVNFPISMEIKGNGIPYPMVIPPRILNFLIS